MDKCVFCDYNIINEGLLGENEQFYHRANMKGAIAPGHSMMISKRHISCFGAIPSELKEEFEEYKKEIESRLKSFFGEQIMVEQGIHGQSVNHAHLHFFPRTSEWYDFSKNDFIDFVPKEIPITKAKGIEEICKIFEQEGQYVSIEERGEMYVCHTKKYKGELRPVRIFPTELTGDSTLLYWQTMSKAEKRKNSEWIEKTIKKLRAK